MIGLFFIKFLEIGNKFHGTKFKLYNGCALKCSLLPVLPSHRPTCDFRVSLYSTLNACGTSGRAGSVSRGRAGQGHWHWPRPSGVALCPRPLQTRTRPRWSLTRCTYACASRQTTRRCVAVTSAAWGPRPRYILTRCGRCWATTASTPAATTGKWTCGRRPSAGGWERPTAPCGAVGPRPPPAWAAIASPGASNYMTSSTGPSTTASAAVCGPATTPTFSASSWTTRSASSPFTTT